jgi:aspartate aminotransferase
MLKTSDRAAAAVTASSLHLSERVRSLKPSSTLAVDARCKAMKAAGMDVIAFGTGEPDFDTPLSIKQAAIDALMAGRTHYVATDGDPEARAAIARKLKHDNNIECGPEHIVISVGAKHSVYLALQCLLDTGKRQQVILPTPAWVSYRPMIELAGGEVIEVPGLIDNDFKITPQQLEKVITDRTAAIIINSPSNPCGTMYSPEELKALAKVLEPHESIAIITDEIYEKLVFGGVTHFSLASLPSIAQRVITVNGMSKAYAMTGWRVGYACATSNGFARAMAKLQGQMTSNITSFVYPAVTQALTGCAKSIELMRQAFAKRAELIYRLVSAMPGVRCARPTGAFYVFPDISEHFGKKSPAGREINSAQAFAEALLEEAKVAVVPGEDFGECARTHVRLSFATSDKNIEQGSRRMSAFIESLR